MLTTFAHGEYQKWRKGFLIVQVLSVVKFYVFYFTFRLPSNDNVFLDFNLHQAHKYKSSEEYYYICFSTKNRYRLIIILVNKMMNIVLSCKYQNHT